MERGIQDTVFDQAKVESNFASSVSVEFLLRKCLSAFDEESELGLGSERNVWFAIKTRSPIALSLVCPFEMRIYPYVSRHGSARIPEMNQGASWRSGTQMMFTDITHRNPCTLVRTGHFDKMLGGSGALCSSIGRLAGNGHILRLFIHGLPLAMSQIREEARGGFPTDPLPESW